MQQCSAICPIPPMQGPHPLCEHHQTCRLPAQPHQPETWAGDMRACAELAGVNKLLLHNYNTSLYFTAISSVGVQRNVLPLQTPLYTIPRNSLALAASVNPDSDECFVLGGGAGCFPDNSGGSGETDGAGGGLGPSRDAAGATERLLLLQRSPPHQRDDTGVSTGAQPPLHTHISRATSSCARGPTSPPRRIRHHRRPASASWFWEPCLCCIFLNACAVASFAGVW